MTERHGKILTYRQIKTALAREASFIYDNYGANYYIEYPPLPPKTNTNP